MTRAGAGGLLAALLALAAAVAPQARAQELPGAAAPRAEREEDVMVLVVGARSPVAELDAIDLKRLFLGIPVVAGGSNLRGVLNFSDERLRDLFYQHVVGMTRATYERRILELTLEQGRRGPAQVEAPGALPVLLQREPLAVSFAWRSQVAGHSGLRIVRELWHP